MWAVVDRNVVIRRIPVYKQESSISEITEVSTVTVLYHTGQLKYTIMETNLRRIGLICKRQAESRIT
jgi:hypothetical protein